MWQQEQPVAAGSSPSRHRIDDKSDHHFSPEGSFNFVHIASPHSDSNRPDYKLGIEVICGDPRRGRHDLRAKHHCSLEAGHEYGTSIPRKSTVSTSFMPLPAAPHVTPNSNDIVENQCAKEESGQLDDMQTQSSLEDRSSVVQAANASNTHHSAGETLFRNYWSQPKRRKTDSTHVSNTVVAPAHESPTKRKLSNLESDIIIVKQVEQSIKPIPQTSSHTSSDLTSEHLMADQESSKSSTEEEVSGAQEVETAAATTSITRTESHQDFFTSPAGKKAEVSELGLQSRFEAHMVDPGTPSMFQMPPGSGGESTSRPGPPEEQFYPQVPTMTVASDPKRAMSTDLGYQTDDARVLLDLDMQISSKAHAGGSGGSGSGSKRSLEEPGGNEEWLQLGLRLTPKTPSSSRIVPQFEFLESPVSRSTSAPSRRYSPTVPSGPTDRSGQQFAERDPAERNFPVSLSTVPMQGHSSSYSGDRLQPGLVGFLPGLGAAGVPSSQSRSEQQYGAQYHGPSPSSSRGVPPIPYFLSLAGANTASPSRGVQLRDSPQQIRTRSEGQPYSSGVPQLQWSGRDPYVNPTRAPGDSAPRMSGRQPGYGPGHIASGQESSQRAAELSNLISGFPGSYFSPSEMGPSLPWRDQHGAGSFVSQRQQSSERTQPQDQRARLPWYEAPSSSEPIQLPPRAFPSRAGGPGTTSFRNVGMQEGQFRAFEKLLDQVGPTTSMHFSPLQVAGESELQDVNLPYKRKLDQTGPPGPWHYRERARADPTWPYEGAGPSRRGQRSGPTSQGWPPTPEGFLHLSPASASRPHLQEQELGRAASPNVPHPGLWFQLQAAEPSGSKIQDQLPSSYIRVMDESTPVSMVKKYVEKKLNLPDDSEVDIACNGHEVQPSLSLQLVRDQIWQTGSTPPRISPLQASSSNTPDIHTLMRQGAVRENSDGTYTSPRDVVMVLTYRIRPRVPSSDP